MVIVKKGGIVEYSVSLKQLMIELVGLIMKTVYFRGLIYKMRGGTRYMLSVEF